MNAPTDPTEELPPETSALERIHHPAQGFIYQDFAAVKPNTALVEPVQGPEFLGVIAVPGSSLGPAACRILYRVVVAGPHMADAFAEGETGIALRPGDVVIPRNGMFDPVGPNLFAIGTQHVLALIDETVAGGPAAELDDVELTVSA